MSESSADELRLRATEAQMRRALGLGQEQASTPQRETRPPSYTGAAHPHRRRFVRDGEVPVAIVHHDDGARTNKLDAMQQVLREQIASRERAEKLLQEARVTLQDLQTKQAHERMAKDEADRRAEDERQTIEDMLVAERAARQQAEQERDEVEARLREVMTRRETPNWSRGPVSAKWGVSSDGAGTASRSGIMDDEGEKSATVTGSEITSLTVRPSGSQATMKQPRRRGRPPKVSQPEPEFVEWWKPGWRERFR
jgi:hypothetical protein